MPSRKRTKGKARKAAKEAKAKEAAKEEEEESQTVVEASASQRQSRSSLEAQMQRLRIKTATSLSKCSHGRPPLSPGEEKICQDFINAFFAEFISQDILGEGFFTAYEATKDEYADVYSSELGTVISILLCNGTQRILQGDNRKAAFCATLACYFEDYVAVVHKTKAISNWSKVVELYDADDHTLVSYYRKRIPCACLDEKYKEVKSVKKMGVCYNLTCSQPGRMKERSKMFSCTRCGVANYCSVECQRADWKIHKKNCDSIVEESAACRSNQT